MLDNNAGHYCNIDKNCSLSSFSVSTYMLIWKHPNTFCNLNVLLLLAKVHKNEILLNHQLKCVYCMFDNSESVCTLEKYNYATKTVESIYIYLFIFIIKIPLDASSSVS